LGGTPEDERITIRAPEQTPHAYCSLPTYAGRKIHGQTASARKLLDTTFTATTFGCISMPRLPGLTAGLIACKAKKCAPTMTDKNELLIAECRSASKAKSAVQTWIEQNDAVAARLGPQDIIVDLVRASGGKNLFGCRVVLPPVEPQA
jgi:hypothetical protein